MKKIAFVIKLFQTKEFHGGGERLFNELIKRFIQNDFLIDIYCSDSDMQEGAGINKIVIIDEEYNHLNPKSMELFYDKVKTLINDENYDYVISENITPPVGITFLQGHSLVYRQKELKNKFEQFLYNFRKEKNIRISYQQKWMKQGYDKIFVVSERLKQDIIKYFNVEASKIRVVYPGVERPDDNAENKLYVPKDVLTFGLVAPGFKIKGGYLFLKALCVLKENNYDFKAKIIYPKAKKNIFVKLVTKLYNLEQNVEFLGYQQDMKSFYRSVDCMVIPSYEDTFNLVALEAMSNKKLCVISSNCGASEIINEEVNGFVFDMHDPVKNLAAKLIHIIDNKVLINKINEKAFNTAKIFNWDNMFNHFINELINN